jgi:predicted DNA-binding protein
MPRRKKDPRCNVISMRISNEEKTFLEELTRRSCRSISNLMREAMQLYAPKLEESANHK